MHYRFALLLLVIWALPLTLYAQEAAPPTIPPRDVFTFRNASETISMGVVGVGRIHDVAWSSSGQIVAAATSNGIVLMNAERFESGVSQRLNVPEEMVTAVSFSPEDVYLASASPSLTDGSQIVIRLWSMRSSQMAASWNASGTSGSLVFSPDGSQLGFTDGRSGQIWDIRDVNKITLLKSDNWLRIEREWYTGQNTLPVEEPLIRAFSPDGAMIAAANGDGQIEIWNLNQRTSQVTTFSDGSSYVFSPNGRLLIRFASGGNGVQYEVWDIRRGAVVYLNSVAMTGYTFHPTRSTILFGTSDDTLLVWDNATQRERSVLGIQGQRGGDPVYSVAFSPVRRVIAAARMNRIETWDSVRGIKLKAALAAPNGYGINRIVYSPNGNLIASVSTDGLVNLWDATTLKQVGSIIHYSGVYDVDFSPDGRLLVTYADVPLSDTFDLGPVAIFLWNVDNVVFNWRTQEREIAQLPPPSPEQSAPRPQPTTPDATLGRVFHTNQNGFIYNVRFSPDGLTLALTGFGVEIWDVNTILRRGTLSDQDDPLIGMVNRLPLASGPLAWSPDGLQLASGTNGEFYDEAGGAPCSFVIWTLSEVNDPVCTTGHEAPVKTLAYNPTGDVIASGSGGGFDYAPEFYSVRLWNARTGESLATLSGHDDDVQSVVFSPEGNLLASSSGGMGYESTLRLWGVPD